MRRTVQIGVLLAFILSFGSAMGKPKEKPQSLLLIVMDPLAKEMACACVKGYGQRDYRKLAARLEKVVKQRVSIEFSDDLADSMSLAGPGQEVMVIGEKSLVTNGATKAALKCHPLCELTGLDGMTTFNGLFVVRRNDPATELKEIGGRKIFFGLNEADETRGAVMTCLRRAAEHPAEPEKRASYNEAALDALDSASSPPPVAVIPSYALPLLEGCGSMKPGDLKVIGKTGPISFITVFLADNIAAEKEEKILKVLLDIKKDAKLLKAMESREGFKPCDSQKADGRQSSADWPDWRGSNRDGHVPKLPPRLPDTTKLIWKKAAMNGGLAGLSLCDGRLLIAERDFAEENDVYRCLNAENGELVWSIEFPAKGKLDFGQFPRATPVIHDGKAYLLGAFGELRCVKMKDGKVVWKRQLPGEFHAELPIWGMCSTPLIVDDLIVVNPGGTNASLVALDCATGRTRWTTPGLPAAYSSFICGEFGGRRQIVGYDYNSLGGWDVKTGERLWRLVPPVEGDFNVPTPIAMEGSLIVSTENNGTRLYRFDQSGRIIQKPDAEFPDLKPDTATPVMTCGRLFGAHQGLHCLDAKEGLKQLWFRDDKALTDHATLIADAQRVLVITLGGELILLDGKADGCAIISRLRVFEDDVEVYSHPALVGTRLYVRGGSNVVCVDLAVN